MKPELFSILLFSALCALGAFLLGLVVSFLKRPRFDVGCSMLDVRCFLAFLALCLCASVAKAQVPTYSPATITMPATIAAATTTNLATPLFIDAGKQDKVKFVMANSWSVAGESTGNTNLLYTLAPTVDGTIYSTNETVTLASYNRSATAGQLNVSSTNLNANGAKGWFIIRIVNNGATGVCTNGTGSSNQAFSYGIKISAP